MAKQVPRIYLENDPTLLRIVPQLAKQIGLNESIMLMQLEYLVSISKTDEKDGRHWTYQSVRELKDNYFPFWSIATINRTIQKLEKEGYITVSDFNKKKYDKTRWISINYDKVDRLESVMVGGVFQNDTRSNQNDTRSNQNETPIPEIPSEIPSDIKECSGEKTPSRSDELRAEMERAKKEAGKKGEEYKQHLREEFSDIVLPGGLSPEEIKNNVLANLYDYPPEIQHVIREFSIRWKIPPPPKGTSLFKKWIKDAKEIKEQIESAGISAEKAFDETYYMWKTPNDKYTSRKEFDGRFEVLNLGSVVNLTWTAIGNMATGNSKRRVKVYYDANGNKQVREV